MLKTMMIRSAMVVFAWSTSIAALAVANPPGSINVPAGDLATALDSLARQANISVVYQAPQLAGLRTGGVHGNLTPQEAVSKLLEGTKLRVHTDQETGAMLVEPPARSASNPDGAVQPRSRLQLAQAGSGGAAQSVSVAQSTVVEPPPALEEIIVTAQKRAQAAQDVPISIIAISAAEIAQRNIMSIDDLWTAVPGLAINGTGNERRIMLRGIGNALGSASQIGIYLDDADVTSTATQQLDINTYDLQRIEVLRGPQGTLYGEGSMGGTLRFITNDPNLKEFSATADVAGLATEKGEPSQRIQEVVNIPLVDDHLGIRVAGQFDHEGGWINQPAANLSAINGQNTLDLRPKALWRPISDVDVAFTAVIHRDDRGLSTGEDASGNYTQVFGLTTVQRLKDNYDIYNLTASYDFGWAKLLNTVSNVDYRYSYFNVGGRLPILVPPPQPEAEIYTPYDTQTLRTWVDELRLTSLGDGPWQWTLGAFYKHYHETEYAPTGYFAFSVPPGATLPPTGAAPFWGLQNSLSKSVFADTSYKILGRLTLGAGLRAYKDDESQVDNGYQAASFHSVDPRYYADLKLTDRVNLYGSAAKGFRSGGFNPSPTEAPYEPESVWTYEVGVKMSALDRRVDLNADVFYSNYSNYISAGVKPPSPFDDLQNAGNAVIKGIETTVDWRLSDAWTASFNADYLKTYFTQIEESPLTAAFAVGDPIDFAPKYQFTASLQKEFHWDAHPAYARLDYSQQGRSTYRDRSTGSWYFSESDVIYMLNGQVGMKWNDTLSFSLFAQNLLNDRGYESPDVIENAAVRPRPRTVGVKFAASL
jgi:iron complex outermembrane receptor protein